MISLALSLALTLAAAPAAAHRVAVIVGSNSPVEGRASLRYAHEDAKALADVLITNGGFARGDVHVLLDPKPDQVVSALSAARGSVSGAGHDTLLFYYSGHADEGSLYPGGERLPLDQLRTELNADAFSVRIGIIDACRGGSWTQAKGLSPAAPFSVGLNGLTSEGTALLASSSGLEDAHETNALGGSFFTHHLIAGLRGAADSSGDGQITLSEAFAYANRFTVRDTASRSAMTQHPSFDVKLRGRQDLVLTSIGSEATQLLVAQTEGPLEVVQLSTGITVVEGLPGEQVLRLALPPGPYLVRRVAQGGVRSREVLVKEGEATRVDESALLLIGAESLPGKGLTPELRRRHLITGAIGYAPVDTFVKPVTFDVAWTWLIARNFGWQVLHAAVAGPISSHIIEQLERDFGVLPTAFLVPKMSFDSGFVWSPELIRSSASVLSAQLFVAAAIVGFGDLRPFGVDRFSPALSLGGSMSWMFTNPFDASFDVGAVLSVRDSIAALSGSSGSFYHLVTASLGVQFALGEPK